MAREQLSMTAGVVAVLAGVGVAELVAGMATGVPSPLDALGQQVVELAPGGVITGAIELLGGSNRAVLLVMSLVVAAALGAVAGRLAVIRFAAATALVVAVAGLALAAVLAVPGASLPMSVLALVAAAAVTLAVLRALVLRLTPKQVRTSTQPSTGAASGQRSTAAIDRRGFVRGAVGAGVSGLAAGTIGRITAASNPGTEDAEVALPEPASTLPPVEGDLAGEIPGVSPVLTPLDDFFRIDTAISIPRVDPGTWRLRIHGLVTRELELTLDDLLARELVEVDATISCVSNEVGGDLVGTARWLGVRLAELLDEVEPTPDAEQVVGRSVDDWTAGFPLEVARDGRDAIVAVAMDDEQLPPRHGFPARLVVPGLYGYVSATKWLAEIELATWDGFDGYWVPLGWAKRAPVKTSSRIDVPADGDEVDGARAVVAGVAWAPIRGIERVEVQVDGGDWVDAQLAPALSVATWVQWHLTLELSPGEHRLTVRAVDGDGQVQPEGPAPPSPNGAEGWHTVSVRAA